MCHRRGDERVMDEDLEDELDFACRSGVLVAAWSGIGSE